MKKIVSIALFLVSVNAFAQPAGGLDPTFGVGGKVITSITSGLDKAYALAIQTDGKILVAGFSSSTITGKDFTCVRYNTNGSIDNSFGTSGIVITDVQLGSEDQAYCIALQTDGKFILGGSSDDGSNRSAALVRYNSDGSLDAGFGTNGVVLTDFEPNQEDEIRVVKIHQLTGNIIVGGSSQISTNVSKPAVARYLANGTLDTTFNSTGIRMLWVTNLDYQYLYGLEDLAVQPNGKISVAGWRDFPTLDWDADYWACRINTDGTMDVTFSTDGVNVYNGGFNGSDKGFSMILKPNNNIIVAGGGSTDNIYTNFQAFEINADGTSGDWGVVSDFGGLADDNAYKIAEDNDGKFVLVGSTSDVSGINKTFALFRANADASTDANFGNNGKVTTVFGSNAVQESFDALIQPDNKIVAVGYAGNDFAIARYLGVAIPQLDSFVLQLPTDQATAQNYSTLVLNWTDAFGASSYEIQVDVTTNFSSPQTFTSNTSTKTVNNLLVNTQYYWRVRSSDGSNFGAYSDVWGFTTNTLENFSLQTPANNAVNQQYTSLNLNWTDAVGADSYELMIDSSQTFAFNPQTFTPTTSNQTATNLQFATVYYWKVRAKSGNTFGQWSNSWKFTTQNESAASIGDVFSTNLNVYPNPAIESTTLEVHSSLIGKSFSVLGLNGTLFLTGKVLSEKTQIETKNLATGVYFIQVGEQTKQSFKVIKE